MKRKRMVEIALVGVVLTTLLVIIFGVVMMYKNKKSNTRDKSSKEPVKVGEVLEYEVKFGE